MDCAYLSVNRVNGIGENSNISSQLRSELHCASPIPYHVFISCGFYTFTTTNEFSYLLAAMFFGVKHFFKNLLTELTNKVVFI